MKVVKGRYKSNLVDIHFLHKTRSNNKFTRFAYDVSAVNPPHEGFFDNILTLIKVKHDSPTLHNSYTEKCMFNYSNTLFDTRTIILIILYSFAWNTVLIWQQSRIWKVIIQIDASHALINPRAPTQTTCSTHFRSLISSRWGDAVAWYTSKL